MECVNTFLLMDGPNLGDKSVEIHKAVQDFILRSWLMTRDLRLKVLMTRLAFLNFVSYFELVIEHFCFHDSRSISGFIAYALCAADESFRDANCLPSKNQKKEIMGFIAYMFYVQLMKL